MKKAWITTHLLLVAGLLACRISSGVPSTPTYSPPKTATPSPETVISETPVISTPTVSTTALALSGSSENQATFAPTTIPPTTAPLPQQTTYRFAVIFNASQTHASIDETIIYHNNSHEALPELLLIVEPSRREGVFTLNNVIWPGGLQAGSFRLEAGYLHLPLAGALLPGQDVTIEISYTLDLLPNGGSLGFTARQVNFGDWYPYIPPYQDGTGWLAYAPSSVGEYLAFDKANFDVNIQVVDAPAGWEVIAPGLLDASNGNYHFLWENARSFTWSGSEQYVVAEEQFGNVHVRQYTFSNHAHKGEYALQVIGRALTLYNELFIPYPHTELIAIEADFFDGMEYDGLFYLGEDYFVQHDGTAAGYLTALTVHETAHQWWYGVIGNDPAWEPWLDEAFCTYSEYLYYERYAPELTDWWWQFRSDRFHPQGWVNSTIYDHANFRTYVDAVYLQGAHFLHELRAYVGDIAFFATLKSYASTYTDNLVTGNNFFDIVDQEAGVAYRDILAVYFRASP